MTVGGRSSAVEFLFSCSTFVVLLVFVDDTFIINIVSILWLNDLLN